MSAFAAKLAEELRERGWRLVEAESSPDEGSVVRVVEHEVVSEYRILPMKDGTQRRSWWRSAWRALADLFRPG